MENANKNMSKGKCHEDSQLHRISSNNTIGTELKLINIEQLGMIQQSVFHLCQH